MVRTLEDEFSIAWTLNADTRYAAGCALLYARVLSKRLGYDTDFFIDSAVEFVNKYKDWHSANRHEFKPHPQFVKEILGYDQMENSLIAECTCGTKLAELCGGTRGTVKIKCDGCDKFVEISLGVVSTLLAFPWDYEFPVKEGDVVFSMRNTQCTS